MRVQLSRGVGALVASDENIDTSCLLELDGSIVYRCNYPELFAAWRVQADRVRLPDARGVLPGVRFWAKIVD